MIWFFGLIGLITAIFISMASSDFVNGGALVFLFIFLCATLIPIASYFGNEIDKETSDRINISKQCDSLCDANKVVSCIGKKNDKLMVICADKELGQRLITIEIK